MEGSKVAIACIMVVAVLGSGATAAALREDQGAVAPSPMESAGAALCVPAALAALASMAACSSLPRKMEGSKMAIACIMAIAVLASGATALREDQGAAAPSPMESGAVALGVPAALAALASMAAWFF
ncbi:hypothetical protein V6N13_023515 [Hibiscus sabdariffa]|uniref:Uncharacterized protein n=1 Tax=Hibiscus sabdariffa TaxID=183260 RepID=A0ABR2PM22_9ROSI